MSGKKTKEENREQANAINELLDRAGITDKKERDAHSLNIIGNCAVVFREVLNEWEDTHGGDCHLGTDLLIWKAGEKLQCNPVECV